MNMGMTDPGEGGMRRLIYMLGGALLGGVACYQLYQKNQLQEQAEYETSGATEGTDLSIVDANSLSQKHQGVALCDECEKLPGVGNCSECDQTLCESCNTTIHEIGALRHHHLSRFPQTPNCDRCKTNRAAVWCRTCEISYCLDCDHGMHRKGARAKHHRVAVSERPQRSFSPHPPTPVGESLRTSSFLSADLSSSVYSEIEGSENFRAEGQSYSVSHTFQTSSSSSALSSKKNLSSKKIPGAGLRESKRKVKKSGIPDCNYNYYYGDGGRHEEGERSEGESVDSGYDSGSRSRSPGATLSLTEENYRLQQDVLQMLVPTHGTTKLTPSSTATTSTSRAGSTPSTLPLNIPASGIPHRRSLISSPRRSLSGPSSPNYRDGTPILNQLLAYQTPPSIRSKTPTHTHSKSPTHTRSKSPSQSSSSSQPYLPKPTSTTRNSRTVLDRPAPRAPSPLAPAPSFLTSVSAPFHSMAPVPVEHIDREALPPNWVGDDDTPAASTPPESRSLGSQGVSSKEETSEIVVDNTDNVEDSSEQNPSHTRTAHSPALIAKRAGDLWGSP